MEVSQPLETQCVNYIQLKEKAGYPVSVGKQVQTAVSTPRRELCLVFLTHPVNICAPT